MEFFTKFPVMERSALAELRKGIDFVFRDFSRTYGDGIENENTMPVFLQKEFELVDLVSPSWTIQVPRRKK